MTRTSFILVALVVTAALPASAADTSGQFPGVYVFEGSQIPVTDEDRQRLEMKCALAPGVMGENGKGAGYFLDRELFRASGEVSYIKGQEYACRYVPATRMETCESKELSDGKSLSYYRSNIYQVFTPDLQQGHSLLSPEDVAAWKVRGELNPANRFAYHRCTCVNAAEIEAKASFRPNERTTDETGRAMFWWGTDPTPEDYAIAREVVGLFNICKPDVS